MDIVFLVTEGEYSDYRVMGVYSTREKAEAAIELFNGGQIEEYNLDAVPDHPPGMLPWEVRMDCDGNVAACDKMNAEHASTYISDKWRPYGDNKGVCFYQWATDDTHAIKIANEVRAQLIARNEWDTDFYAWRMKRQGF